MESPNPSWGGAVGKVVNPAFPLKFFERQGAVDQLAIVEQPVQRTVQQHPPMPPHVALALGVEAAIRSVVYIGMAGPGVAKRAFEVLRQVRSENEGLTLEEFKRVLREQFFALLLDRDAALAAIPDMLPPDATARADVLNRIRRVVSAVGTPSGARAERLAQIEKLFGASVADESNSSETNLAEAMV